MPTKQKGILTGSSSFQQDADVIMTAAIVGHAYTRLAGGKNCAFDTEVDPKVNPDSPQKDQAEAEKKWKEHLSAVAKINKALATRGGDFGSPGKGKEAIVGVTPVYDPKGDIMRITGGSGDLPLDSPYRYTPALPADLAGSKLYELAKSKPVGYQGRGAYTGFVQGREGGQSNLFTTYRHVVPEFGRRWIPTDPQSENMPAIGNAPDQCAAWGMIGTNSQQAGVLEEGMYFQDQDKARGTAVTLDGSQVLGYTHGMIQAIYDVAFHKAAEPGKNAGTPYEIAVGSKTSKLASCFTCAIFMEATGFPASATHIGRGESWAPLYPEGGDQNSTQNASRTDCNNRWAAYCKTIVDAGIQCMTGAVVTDDHQASLGELKKYLSGKSPADYANLILDAVTVHASEVDRVNRTLKA